MLSSLSDLITEDEGGRADARLHQLHVDQVEQHAAITGDKAVPRRGPRPRGVLSTQDALKAAEHGNSDILAAYLHAGGDPMSVSRLHHMGWSLLHLATGCALMGGLTTSSSLTYRTRPEPDCPNGFATCVSLLLAAGADPNVRSKQFEYTPLIGACLSGDAECCRLLLQAGARVTASVRSEEEPAVDEGGERRAVETPHDAARKARFGEGHRKLVLDVLDDPPRLLPRSPLDVSARLLEYLEGEERERSVEVRWRIPPQRAFTKRGGDIQRYVVRGYVKGEEIEVKHNAVGPAVARRHRRDFCANPVIDRGIALRQNLGLPVPDTASTLIHGLTPSVSYHFTVSCVAEIDDEIRESPPSLMSKPLEIPAIDDEDWNTGEIIEKVLSYSSSSRTHHRSHGDGHAQVLVPGDAPRANDAEIADAWAGKGAPADGAAPPRRADAPPRPPPPASSPRADHHHERPADDDCAIS